MLFRLIFAFVLLLGPMPAMAQLSDDMPAASPDYNSTADEQPSPYHRYKGNLNDFQNLYIQCAAADGDFQLGSTLCALTEMEARASARNTNLRVQPGNNEGDDGLTLAVHMDIANNSLTAVSVIVEVSRMYKEAVDKDASNSDPASVPRQGKLVFFSRNFTAVGRGDVLDEAVRGNLRNIIRSFFQSIERER